MTQTILAQNVAALRRHLGKNQTDFAEMLGTQQANVSKWESKGVEPGGTAIGRMAEWAGVSVRDFVEEIWRPGRNPAPQTPATLDDLAEELGLALIEEVDLAYGMGATYIDAVPEVVGIVPFRLAWLRDMFKGPLNALKVVRGTGDSMQPTIHDGDFVLIDTARNRIDDQDVIWAISYGDLGMIRRLRQLPGGGVLMQADNPVVRSSEAHDGEMHVVGKVIWIGRKMVGR